MSLHMSTLVWESLLYVPENMQIYRDVNFDLPRPVVEFC